MAAHKFNDQGAVTKLSEVFKILLELEPDNIADDNQGGIYTGKSPEEILSNMVDKACIGAAFSDEKKLRKALQKLKEADLGMSIVVTGNFEKVFNVLREVGLKPHTVHMSLGTFGNKEKCPNANLINITSMCGHGMVTSRHTQIILRRMKSGKLPAREGAMQLAKSCTCGIFNPKRAESLIERLSEESVGKNDNR
jgi:hypothetical protein